ncbi:hypothetical protein ElyMa_001245600 [Elysia marginata]|uniref:DUF4604 domain-containing protein n=1 Tax=Elysia marginata TaxID=1093978 RepID=A0AAV4IDG8_9GAST|nr:hypothetical protein ElyMa_001245600 [Elysia marginata]
MADVKETTAEQYPQASPEDEDMRGADGKKKKFKPLSAVRKLFGGKKRKKEESVVAVKAQSTTALHSSRFADDDDEDDDDGG